MSPTQTPEADALFEEIRRKSSALKDAEAELRIPPRPPVDPPSGRGDNEGMEPRLKALEDAMVTVKQDLAVMRSNYATKTDIAELRGELKAQIAETKSTIIMWVVGAIFLAQILPHLPEIAKGVAGLFTH